MPDFAHPLKIILPPQTYQRESMLLQSLPNCQVVALDSFFFQF